MLGAPGLFPAGIAGQTTAMTVPVYFESAAMIVVLVLVGQVLELRARRRTVRRSLRALLDLAPEDGQRLDGRGPSRTRSPARTEVQSRATGCAFGPARKCRWTAFMHIERAFRGR